jgi:hypothetical protein
MKPLFKITCLCLPLLVFLSCGHDQLDIDTSSVNVPEVHFSRMDKDIFALTEENFPAREKTLESAYGNFYKRYVYTILSIPDSEGTRGLLRFINNNEIRQVYNETAKKFSTNDIELLGEELTDCVKRFAYFFPDRKRPKRFVTYISGFNYKVTYTDSTLGIGLDMYLGANHEFYKMLQWPQYQSRKLSKEYMMSDLVRGWLITEFDDQAPVNNLLNHMIFYGKVLYACDALLPAAHDSLKVGYTTAQMKYCKDYEKNLWGFFAEKNRLYENNLKTINDFTGEGPFTGAISKECPPQIGMWIGWQIVRSYMKNNKDVSVAGLMIEKDAQKILNKSKYRP